MLRKGKKLHRVPTRVCSKSRETCAHDLALPILGWLNRHRFSPFVFGIDNFNPSLSIPYRRSGRKKKIQEKEPDELNGE